VKERERFRNASSYSAGQVVEEGDKSGKERTGKGNKNQQKHTRRTQTQVLEGSSQSDVTVEDVESLSREPKRSKTVHVVGPCQKLWQQCGELAGTTPVVYVVSVFDRDLKLRGWSTVNNPLPTN
jgi:hypothetical protein